MSGSWWARCALSVFLMLVAASQLVWTIGGWDTEADLTQRQTAIELGEEVEEEKKEGAREEEGRHRPADPAEQSEGEEEGPANRIVKMQQSPPRRWPKTPVRT